MFLFSKLSQCACRGVLRCELCAQSCPTLCDPMDGSPPGSSVHGILQVRILACVTMPSSRGSSWSRDGTCVSCIGRQNVYHCTTWDYASIFQTFSSGVYISTIMKTMYYINKHIVQHWADVSMQHPSSLPSFTYPFEATSSHLPHDLFHQIPPFFPLTSRHPSLLILFPLSTDRYIAPLS